jgi:hypothetical protein
MLGQGVLCDCGRTSRCRGDGIADHQERRYHGWAGDGRPRRWWWRRERGSASAADNGLRSQRAGGPSRGTRVDPLAEVWESEIVPTDLSPADPRCSGCRDPHREYLSRTQSSRRGGADGKTPMNFAVLPPEAPAATDAIYQLLAVLADRAKTKAALAKVVAARNEAQAAAEKLGDLQIERAALQRQQAEFGPGPPPSGRRSAKRIVRSMPAGQSSMSNARFTPRRSRPCAPTASNSSGRGAPMNEARRAGAHAPGARLSAAGREGELPVSQIRLLRRGGQDAGRLCRAGRRGNW